MPESIINFNTNSISNQNRIINCDNNLNYQVPMSSSSLCMGCGHLIKDQYIYKVQPDMQWHESCLKCNECNCRLEENSTCFIRNNKAYCKQDYVRLFTAKCHKCSQVLKRNDLVMKSKSKVYHLECFCCVLCCKKLMPGEEYFQTKEGHLYCKEDSVSVLYAQGYPSLAYQHLSSTMSITPENSVTSSSSFSPCNGSSSSSSSSSIVDSPNFTNFHTNNTSIQHNIHNKFAENDSYQDKEEDNSVSDEEESTQHNDNDLDCDDDQDVSISDDDESFNESTLSASTRKHKKQTSQKSTLNNKKLKLNNNFNTSSPNYLQNCFGSNNNNSSTSTNGSSGKPARIRTVLNEKQLHTLRACYGANPRPDALMKEQLVEMTGLNPRVIRVWFQNKRCKDKKKNMLIRPSNEHAGHMHHHISINGQFNHVVTSSSQSTNQIQLPTHPMFDSCF